MRDRLIELLEATGMVENRARCSIIADELIAQGVVLPAPMDANGRIHKDFFAILRDDSYGICPAPTSDRLAIQTLCDYLLGEDWYIAMSMSREQANTIIVDTILEKYSKRYRRDVRRADDEQAD